MDAEKMRILVPKAFCHPLFYETNDEIIIKNGVKAKEVLSMPPFYFDIVASELHLWESPEQVLPVIFQTWTDEKERVAPLFRKKNKEEARIQVIKWLAALLDSIYWTNHCPIKNVLNWQDEVKNLQIQPINSIERLNFIFENPHHYHSFIQITQLFLEVEKLYYKSVILNKERRNL